MKKLLVYPTMRATLKELDSSSLSLDKDIISLESFFSKCLYIKDKFLVSKEKKYLYLKEAVESIDLAKLGIDDDFLFFLKNKDVILKFFNEMNNENVSFENIRDKDIYDEFIEHTLILEALYNSYQDILDKNNTYDSSSSIDYFINEIFISEYDVIEIFIEGYLSKKEIKLLNDISKFSIIKLHINATRFNMKVYDDLNIDVKDRCELNQKYIYNLNTKKIEDTKSIKQENQISINLYGLNDDISQAYFVFYKIDEYIKSGILPEDIVVVLPNEVFAKKLQAFDVRNNLNFAMGHSFSTTKAYKKLNTLYNYLLDNNAENSLMLEVLGIDIETTKLKTSDDVFDVLKEFRDDESASIIDEFIWGLSKIKKYLEIYSFLELLSYVMHEMKSKNIDDNRGGKIKVMGILESRYLKFEAIIITNFNDKVAPKHSKKDMFLNSKLKKFASMPTREDRYNLQKYFYYRIMQNANHISISYLSSDKDMKSSFLDEIEKNGVNMTYHDNEFYFTKKILNQKIIRNHHKTTKEININKNISFSKLKTFIDCKKKFHFKYNLSIKNAQVIEILPSILKVGIEMHDIFANMSNVYTIKQDILKRINNKKEYSFYLLELYLKADKIISLENQLKNDGYETLAIEKEFNVKYKGFTLKGRIDRINKKGNKLYIIDYKYHQSSAPKDVKKYKLQLLFYFVSAKLLYPEYEVVSSGIYDLRFMKISFLQDDLLNHELLDEELNQYNQEFETSKCESKTICSYCEYNVICDRG